MLAHVWNTNQSDNDILQCLSTERALELCISKEEIQKSEPYIQANNRVKKPYTQATDTLKNLGHTYNQMTT